MADVSFDDLAVIFTSTEVGHAHTVTAFMTVGTAMAYCSDNRTRGKRYGSEWSTFWTRVCHYFGDGWWQQDDLRKAIAEIRDDGRFPEYKRVPNELAFEIVAERSAEDQQAKKVTEALANPEGQDALW